MTLAGLGHAPVTVVDDGSQEAVAVAGEIEVIRSPENRGPSAARNTGWTAVSATLDQVTSDNTIIGFIDAGVSIDEADMRDLVQHFDDPHIVAVAPRVQSRPGDDRISTYDRERSPLDMGPNPAAVQPGQPVSYVPGACLLVRLSKLVELDGFDETLRYGEDVDLVWRLSRQGIVRYEPSVVATHTPRSTLKGFARQRFGYGSSAGPLSQRHGTALTPLVISRWSLPIVGLTLLGHPIMAAGIASAYVPSQASKLGELPDPMIEAMRIVVSGNLSALQSTADTAVRIWSPLTLLLSFTPFRRVSAISAALAWGRMAMTDGVDKLPLRIIDDLAYAAGVWRHSVRWRTAAPLRPRIL